MRLLIDTHVHLEEILKIEDVLRRAKSTGIISIIAVGIGQESNEKILKISKDYPGFVYSALGIHPSEVKEQNDDQINFIREKIIKCVAIGEIGLDYRIKKEKAIQIKVFQELLNLAFNKDLPVSIHSRGAWRDCYEYVRSQNIKKAVFHWYDGPKDVLKHLLDSGYLISATPAAEYSRNLREAIALTPIENILLETDSPVNYKGIKSEPATIVKSMDAVSEIKGIDQNTVALETTKNAKKFFGFKSHLLQ